jgi:hypothetical protein
MIFNDQPQVTSINANENHMNSPTDSVIPDPGASADAVKRLDERLNRLSDEISAVQVQIAEKRKPWYLQVPLLVSIAALLFTVTNTIWTHTTDSTAKGNERLQSIISQLSEIRTEEAKDLLNSKTDFSAYATRAGLRNTKRIALLEDADAALAEVKGNAPAAIYVSLGTEAESESQYRKADGYFAKAIIKASPQSSERMWAKFDSAVLRFIPDSPFYSLSAGRELSDAAVAAFGANDDNARFQRGQVLTRIGQIEAFNHDERRSQSSFARAAQEVQPSMAVKRIAVADRAKRVP